MSQEDSIAAEVQQIDAAEVYRSIGRLERKVSHLVVRLDRIEPRLDRLIFALFAVGGTMGAAVAAIMANLFLGS